MKLFAWNKNAAAALHQYRQCARKIQAEFNQPPEPETQALYEDIRTRRFAFQPCTETTAAGPLPEAIQLQPEEVMPQVPPHNLPLEPTPFIGRNEELAEIVRLLQQETACRLLTLLGLGGIGKSRLALRAAESVLDDFTNGVFFVQLEAVSSPDMIVPAIGEVLGLSFQSRPSVEAQLLNYLEAKKLLLVLDNLEHLLEDTGLITAILARALDVKILVTSRERLNIQAEWIYETRGLPFPSDDVLAEKKPEAITAYPAVQLFLERTRSLRPDFVPSADDLFVTARICQIVEGIPLGLELAAAWMRLMPCREIVHQIEQDYDFLTTSLRDVPGRHRSFRKLFECSWELLPPQERDILKKLAVFRGGFEHAAALEVAGAALPVLAALVDKSMLRSEPSGRFNLHGLVQNYVFEKLSSQPESMHQVQDRHCSYYTDYLKNRELQLRGENQPLILAEIAADIDNIRAAWKRAVAQAKVAELGAALESLHLFYFGRSWYHEADQAFDAAVKSIKAQLVDDLPSTEAVMLTLSRLLSRQGRFAYRLGREQSASDLLNESLEILHNLPNGDEEAAFPLYHLSELARGDGDYLEAERLCQESLDLYRQFEDICGMARAYNHLGILAGMQGKFAQAEGLLQQALDLYRDSGDLYGIANVLNDLGIISDGMGKGETAWQLYKQGLAIRRKINQPTGIGASLNNMGYYAYLHGDYQAARQLLEESLIIQRDVGDRFHIALCLNNLGSVMGALNQKNISRQHYAEALQLALKIDVVPLALEVLAGLAKQLIHGDQAEQEQAAELLAFVHNHPASDKPTRDLAEEGLQTLADNLAPNVLSEARSRGSASELDAILGLLNVDVYRPPIS
jgi:predicted ATPase